MDPQEQRLEVGGNREVMITIPECSDGAQDLRI